MRHALINRTMTVVWTAGWLGLLSGSPGTPGPLAVPASGSFSVAGRVDPLRQETTQPIELGRVGWGRDLEQARGQSAQSGKPVLVLFQEVPGCQTCQDFGGGPLSHPLMVEAIEELFEPVLVYNNQASDEAILNSLGEPSWNNPVVRFLNDQGQDLIPRQDGVWQTVPLARRMADSLHAAGRDVPDWFKSVVASQPDSPALATFAMHCYWEGEAKLGALNGVVSTHSAWIGDREVVQLAYDPSVIGYEQLVNSAHELECASTVYTRNREQYDTAAAVVGQSLVETIDKNTLVRDAKSTDQKYALAQSACRYLPLTEYQAVKVNAALHANRPQAARQWLSPRQRELLSGIERSLSRDAASLNQWQRPTDEARLAEYDERLRQAVSGD